MKSSSSGKANPELISLDASTPAGGKKSTGKKELGENMKVFVRLRPFTIKEREGSGESTEEAQCLQVVNPTTLLLTAPPESHQFKRSVSHSTGTPQSSFSFSQVFGPETGQQEFYERAIAPAVAQFVGGENGLMFAYGVTNSGKTYTVQGSAKSKGVLPRAMSAIFGSLGSRQYVTGDVRPSLFEDIELIDGAVLEEADQLRERVLGRERHSSSITDLTVDGASMSTSPSMCDVSDVHVPSLPQCGDGGDLDQFAVWLTCAEVYQEQAYDLLAPTQSIKNRRKILHLREDRGGQPYIHGLQCVNVRSAEEACSVVSYAQRNLQIAGTALNISSSRSHAIFTIKLVRIPDPQAPASARLNTLSLCDLAGSERSSRTNSLGERQREAGNINVSLMTLGKCIAALRHNQLQKGKNKEVVPFRESKLTRLFQSFFCGRGQAAMIVNASPCSSDFDETLEVFRFSAVAQQVTFDKRASRSSSTQRPVTRSRSSVDQSKSSIDPASASKKMRLSQRPKVKAVRPTRGGGSLTATISELDESKASENSFTDREKALLVEVGQLKQLLAEEEAKRYRQEVEVRAEICEVMGKRMTEMEQNCRDRIEHERAAIDDIVDAKISIYTEAVERTSRKRPLGESGSSSTETTDSDDGEQITPKKKLCLDDSLAEATDAQSPSQNSTESTSERSATGLAELLNAAEQDVKKLTEQLVFLQAEQGKQESHLDQLKEENCKILEDNKILEEKVKLQDSRLAEIQLSVSEIETVSLKNASDHATAKEVAKLETEIGLMQSEKADWLSQLKKLEEQHAQTKEENAALLQKVSLQEAAALEFAKAKEQISRLTAELDTSQALRESYGTELSQLKFDLCKTEGDKSKFLLDMNIFESEMEQLKKQLSSCETEKVSLEDQLTQQNKEVERLISQLSEMKNQETETETKLKQFGEVNNSSKRENSALLEQIKVQDLELAGLKDKLSLAEEQAVTTEIILSDTDELHKAQDRCRTLEKSLEEANSLIAQLKSQEQKDKWNLEQEVLALTKGVKVADEERAKAETQSRRMKRQLSEAEQDLKTTLRGKEEMEGRLKRLGNAHFELEENICVMECNRDQLKQQRDMLKTQLEETLAQLESKRANETLNQTPRKQPTRAIDDLGRLSRPIQRTPRTPQRSQSLERSVSSPFIGDTTESDPVDPATQQEVLQRLKASQRAIDLQIRNQEKIALKLALLKDELVKTSELKTELEGELANERKVAIQLQSDLTQAQQTLEELRKEKETLVQTDASITELKTKLEGELADEKKMATQLQSDLTQAQQTLEELRKEKETLVQTDASITELKANLEQAGQDVAKAIKDKNESVNNLQTLLDKQTSELAVQRSSFETMTGYFREITSVIKSEVSKCSGMDSYSSDDAKQPSGLTALFKSKMASMESFQRIIQLKSAAIVELEGSLTEKSAKEQSNAEQIEKLQSGLEVKADRVTSLENELRMSSEKLCEVELQRTAIRDEDAHTTAQTAQALSDLKGLLESEKKTCSALQTEMDTLKQQKEEEIRCLEEKLDNVSKKSAVHEGHVILLKSQMVKKDQSLSENLEKEREEKTQLAAEVKQLVKEVETSSDELKEAAAQIKELKAEKAILVEDIRCLRVTNEDAQCTEVLVDNLKAVIEEQEQTMCLQDTLIQQREQELEQKDLTIQQKETALRDRDAKLAALEESHKDHRKTDNENISLRIRINQLEKESTSRQQEKQNMADQLASANEKLAEIDDLKSAYKRQEETLERRVSSLQDTINNLLGDGRMTRSACVTPTSVHKSGRKKDGDKSVTRQGDLHKELACVKEELKREQSLCLTAQKKAERIMFAKDEQVGALKDANQELQRQLTILENKLKNEPESSQSRSLKDSNRKRKSLEEIRFDDDDNVTKPDIVMDVTPLKKRSKRPRKATKKTAGSKSKKGLQSDTSLDGVSPLKENSREDSDSSPLALRRSKRKALDKLQGPARKLWETLSPGRAAVSGQPIPPPRNDKKRRRLYNKDGDFLLNN